MSEGHHAEVRELENILKKQLNEDVIQRALDADEPAQIDPEANLLDPLDLNLSRPLNAAESKATQ